MMDFRIINEISNIETIAKGTNVQIRKYLNEQFGRGNWRKMKGEAMIEWEDGRIEYAEIHWFEAHGIGRKLTKRKRSLRK
jgi:hypothetical protein